MSSHLSLGQGDPQIDSGLVKMVSQSSDTVSNTSPWWDLHMEWKNKTALAAMALSLILALVDVQSCHLETSQSKNGNYTPPSCL